MAIAYLDEDLEPLCGFGVQRTRDGQLLGEPVKCKKPAGWIATCRRCNATFWSCSDCRHTTILLDRVRCWTCEALLPGKDLFTFDPIPGGSS